MEESVKNNEESPEMSGIVTLSSDAVEFRSLLQEAIDSSKSTGLHGGMLLVDISNISVIMHINGRPFVDEMMQTISDLLRTILVTEVTICRTQVNCLTIIIADCSDEQMRASAEKIYKSIRAVSCTFKEAPVYIIPFLGSVFFSDDVENADDALDKGYIALKNTERQYNRYYSTYADTKKDIQFLKNRMLLANCMEDSLTRHKLRLAFQPIIDSKTGATSHHECLLRIITGEGKLISVGPFIPVVEEMGFIDEIDELVLELVCQELQESPDIHLGFNISGIGIDNPTWLKRAKILFKDPDIASRAIVEITETAALDDVKKAARFVMTLQDMGCQVALDDFGAGHTSFRQLKSLPVDIVKIDGSFITDIVDNPNNRLFVTTLLEICKGFGLKTVAEFVENGEIAKLLMELKVDYMQGHYFSPALNYRSWRPEEMLD